MGLIVIALAAIGCTATQPANPATLTVTQTPTELFNSNPTSAEDYYNRGNTYFHNGDYDHAIADFDKAIQLKRDNATAYNNRGIAYAKKGDYNRAIADFDMAIQLQPDLAKSYGNRGLAYKLKGENDKAIADFRKVLELSNDPSLRQSAENELNEFGVQ